MGRQRDSPVHVLTPPKEVRAVLIDMVGTIVRCDYKYLRNGHPSIVVPSVADVEEWWRASAGPGAERDLVAFLASHGHEAAETIALDIARLEARGMTAYEDAAPALKTLTESGLVLAIVSNTCAPSGPFRTALERLGLAQYFREMVFSVDVGYRKPHPGIFEEAIARLGVSRRHVVHVGDLPSRDIAGARAAGICGLLIDRAAARRPASSRTWTLGSLRDLPGVLVRP